ncbi:hypothetical protein C8J57DRAFT_1736922 [Mycena rebaudengoi]|nr:hypothetical protein C8J57DRAFT_1736922 [Mycena rebaudengoi]
MKGCLVRHLCVVHASHEKVTRCCGIFVASRGPPPPAPSHRTRYLPGVTASSTTAYPTESRILVAYSMDVAYEVRASFVNASVYERLDVASLFRTPLPTPARLKTKEKPWTPKSPRTRCPHKLPVRDEVPATARQTTTTTPHLRLWSRNPEPGQGSAILSLARYSLGPLCVTRRRYFSLIFHDARCPHPQSHRAILPQLSTCTSKRSRAHDTVPLTTMLDSTVAALLSTSSSVAADALGYVFLRRFFALGPGVR